jgi:hypothetical protein
MKAKCNLALVPTTQGEAIVKFAKYFSHIADQYILGEYSLPHVTLYQFICEQDQLDGVWERVTATLQKKSLSLAFDELSCVTFDHEIYWISLLPHFCDALITMHHLVADLIHEPVKKNYDPHMTLINTKNTSYQTEVDKMVRFFVPIRDQFILALGKSDDIGQLTDVLFSYR